MPKINQQLEGTEIKVFLGFLKTSELKMHLSQSSNWQRAKSLNENFLIEIIKEEKDYIGIWIPSALSYDLVKKNETEVRSQLQLYCPKIKLDAHSLYLFTQIFVN